MFSSLFIVLLFYPSSHLSPSISLLPFSFIFRTRRSIAIILRFSCGYPRCHTVLRVSSVNILRLPIPWSRICFSLPLPSIFECIVDPSAHRSKVSLINRNRKEESIRGSTWKQLCLCSTTFMYKDIVRFSLRSDYAWPFSSFFFFFHSAICMCVCVCMRVCVCFMGRFRCSCARFFSCSSFIYFFLLFLFLFFFFSFFFRITTRFHDCQRWRARTISRNEGGSYALPVHIAQYIATECNRLFSYFPRYTRTRSIVLYGAQRWT